MNQQTLRLASSQNQGQANASDLLFSIEKENSQQNISDPSHNSQFCISKQFRPLLINNFHPQDKAQQKIASQNSNPQNQASFFINQNITTPLNAHQNSSSDDFGQKEAKNLAESDDEQNEKPSQITGYEFQSDKLQKYFDFMKNNLKNSDVYKNESLPKQKFQKEFFPLIKQLQTKLEQNDILKIKNQEVFTSVLIKNITEYGNYEIVELDVRLGKYEKNVKIYHLVQESCFHKLNEFNQGSFGSIYLCNFMEAEFIVKCVSKTNKNNYEDFHNFKEKPAFLKEILKEYMIAYIAGILEIGPKVLNPFGFDLIVSKKCIEFFMQKCTVPQDNLREIHNKFQELKSSLFKLHLLDLVHNDIKPQNIMYNRKTDKLLFIDFGLSEYSEKPIGHKKEIKFLGTYQYASPQMKKLLYENESGMIDLFYNDAYSLNLALNKMFQIQKVEGKFLKEPEYGTTSKQTQNFLNIIFLKFLIWKQKVDQAITLSNIMGLKKQFQLQQSILQFIQKIRSPSKLKYFYHQSIHQSVKQNPKFQRVKEAYVKNIWFGEIELQQKNQDYKDFRNLYQHLQNMQHQITEKQTSFKQRSVTKLQKKHLLLGKGQKINDQKIWLLYVDFVNFLKRNEMISIQEKQEVSQFMIERFQIKCNLSSDGALLNVPNLTQIAQCLYFILRECLTPASKYFQPNCISKLLSLLMLLGWDIPDKYLIEWRQIVSLWFEDLHEKIISYLNFQIIQQISLNRYFKFQNKKCLNEIDLLIKAMKQQHEGHKVQKQSFYDNLIDERKRQNFNLQTQKLINIVIQMLQFNFNSENITQHKLDQLVNDIELLPHTLFKSKNKYLWVKSQLLFCVALNYSIIRIDQEKQLKLLQKIKSLQQNSYHHLEILVYHFQIIALYQNLKNFHQLKLQLDYVERTINCDEIRQNICIPQRLMLSYMLKDFDQFRKVIRKIQRIEMKDITDVNLLRHTAYCYQNIHLYSFNQNTEEYINEFTYKIQTKMKQFIQDFDQNSSFRTSKLHRLCFTQFLRPIFALSYQNYHQNQDEDRIFSIDNLKFILKVLQNLSSEFSDNEIITTYITQRMNFLLVQKKYSQACQFLENQNHIKFTDLRLTNYRQAAILTNYYYFKICTSKDNKKIYISRLKEIYDELISKGSYNFIFSDRKLFCVILNDLQNYQQIFQFFKAMSEHINQHPSAQNVEIFISYVNDFVMKVIQKQQDQLQIENSQKQQQNQTIENPYPVQQKAKKAIDIFRGVYGLIRKEVNFNRLWENPYMVLVIYILAMYGQVELHEALMINIVVCRNIKYLNFQAKRFIFKNYYWVFYEQKRAKNSYRKSTYLLKKHLKVTSQIYEFQSVLKIRQNKKNLLSNHHHQFPGQSYIRKKLYRYYDSLEILKKINYYDSISTFSSEKSLTDSID